MKRIGFYDLDLDNFHATVYLGVFRQELHERGFEVTGCTAIRQKSSQSWAEENNVPYFKSVTAMNSAVDYYMILAPRNPEHHLSMCMDVFPFGKATYVDKTFAPDLRTARRIFALADKHQVPVQTSSPLRYSNVQDFVLDEDSGNVKHMVVWQGGRSFDEYGIHAVEILVSCMGTGVMRLMRRGTGKYNQILIELTGDRTAVINMYAKHRTQQAASVTTTEETRYMEVDRTQIFPKSTEAILDLFESGKANIPRKESLLIRRILDVAEQKRARNGFVTI